MRIFSEVMVPLMYKIEDVKTPDYSERVLIVCCLFSGTFNQCAKDILISPK